MKQTKVLRNLLMSASAISGIAFVEAQAQEIAMADTGDAKADAIIVTGTRRETTIQDATINLQAISAEELQRENSIFPEGWVKANCSLNWDVIGR